MATVRLAQQDTGLGIRFLTLRSGALACADANPGAVSASLRRYLLASHFDGFTLDLRSLPTTFVVGKLADSPPMASWTLCTLYEKLSGPAAAESFDSLWLTERKV